MLYYFQSIIFRDENEHDLEHDFNKLKLYSDPKIYTANGDLTKRWYVYFSYKNPITGKMERVKNIYGITNRYKTKEKRLQILTIYRRNLLQLLKKGYNPFEDNTALYQSFQREEQQKPTIVEPAKQTIVVEPTIDQTPPILTRKNEQHISSKTIEEAFQIGLKLKSKLVSKRTLQDYQGKLNRLQNWLQKHQPEVTHCEHLTKKMLTDFLNEILINSSPRNRNNYRTDLSSIFQVLKENEIIEENYFMLINKLKTNPEVHKVYTQDRVNEIYDYLEEKDPILLLYIKFMAMALMRPVEVCRLKIGDINLKNKTIQFKAKNSPLKTKIIPQILLDELPDLSTFDKHLFVFTPTQIGGEWNTTEDNKRGYFTKRFKKLVKDKFKLDKEQTLYSFRHTYISKIYKKLRESHTPFEAKSKLMFITGHSTMKALEAYLRSIEVELPKDYSNLLE